MIILTRSFTQVTNLSPGLWSTPSLWSSNNVPTGSDSIYLSYDVIIDINASCGALNTNGHNVTVNSGVIFTLVVNPRDIDGNVYNTVSICSQIWMKENLAVSHYKNGDTIPQITDFTQWINLTTGAWCYYNNDPATEAVYGKLYNWYAVNDPRGIAPSGWHLPNETEWSALVDNCLGGFFTAGGPMKEAGLIHWYSPNSGATNSSGFTGLPGGSRNINNSFDAFGTYGYWWSSTSYDITNAWIHSLASDNTFASTFGFDKKSGFSVRCIKN